MNCVTRFFAGIVIPLILMIGCESSPRKISEVELEILKSKYSAEVVNYFYETVFYQDYVGITPSLDFVATVRMQESSFLASTMFLYPSFFAKISVFGLQIDSEIYKNGF